MYTHSMTNMSLLVCMNYTLLIYRIFRFLSLSLSLSLKVSLTSLSSGHKKYSETGGSLDIDYVNVCSKFLTVTIGFHAFGHFLTESKMPKKRRVNESVSVGHKNQRLHKRRRKGRLKVSTRRRNRWRSSLRFITRKTT